MNSATAGRPRPAGVASLEVRVIEHQSAAPDRLGRKASSSQMGWWRPDCVAGHVGLELRNVDTNYPFERSHRFAGIQPNSGFGDYSRLSCGVGDTQLGRRPGSRQGCLRGRHQPSSRGFPGSEPNSGHGDHSRLSCSAGDTQLGAGFCRDLQQAFCTGVGHHAASPRRHELAAISFNQKMIRRRQSQQHNCSVCAGLSAQRERVW
jgi:hypothetical protein